MDPKLPATVSAPNRDCFLELSAQTSLLADLEQVYANSSGIGVLTGPSGCGKSRILHAYAERLKPAVATAIVSGGEADEVSLLNSVFAQFGYDYSSTVLSELQGMLRVFAVQQTGSGTRPLLIVRDSERMSPAVGRLIAKTADIQSGHKPAIAIIFAGTAAATERLAGTDLNAVLARCERYLSIEVLDADDLARYLLEQYGIALADEALFEKLLDVSGGLPGAVDAFVRNAKRTGKFSDSQLAEQLDRPLSEFTPQNEPAEKSPHLLISQSGQLLGREPIDRRRIMVGRAVHNDLQLDSRYVSRHHALLVAGPEGADWLIDLNSRNGTFVNSRAIDYVALRHNDVIAIGNHRLKYMSEEQNGPRPAREVFANSATSVMQTLPESAAKLVPVVTKKAESQ